MDAVRNQSLSVALGAYGASQHGAPARVSLRPAGGLSSQSRREQLTKQAERLVAQTFFGTLLRQMNNSPFKSEMFSGGRGGEAFGSLYNQHLADRMAHAAGRSLVRSIVRHLERVGGGAGAGEGETGRIGQSANRRVGEGVGSASADAPASSIENQNSKIENPSDFLRSHATTDIGA